MAHAGGAHQGRDEVAVAREEDGDVKGVWDGCIVHHVHCEGNVHALFLPAEVFAEVHLKMQLLCGQGGKRGLQGASRDVRLERREVRLQVGEATTAAEATVGEAKRSRGEGAADLHRPEHTLALGDHILVVRPEGGEDEHAHDFNRALSIRLRPRQLRREMV